MSIYWSRSFPRSNSSIFLSSGYASKSSVIRLREEKFLVDTGLGTPKIRMKDELTNVPQYRRTARFENKVGYSFNVVAGESTLKKRGDYERFFSIGFRVRGGVLKKERMRFLIGILALFKRAKSASLLKLFLLFLGNLCLGVLLWWLAAGMDTMVEQAANIEFWGHMFVRELLAQIRGSNVHVPMTLGGEEEKIERTSHSIGTIPISHMMGQGQVEGGHQELDLNKSVDPEITLPYPYKRSVEELTRLVQNEKPIVKEGLFPNYNRRLTTKNNPTIQASIADFLKQRDASTLRPDSAALVALGKESPLFQEFIDYLLQKQDRGVE